MVRTSRNANSSVPATQLPWLVVTAGLVVAVVACVLDGVVAVVESVVAVVAAVVDTVVAATTVFDDAAVVAVELPAAPSAKPLERPATAATLAINVTRRAP